MFSKILSALAGLGNLFSWWRDREIKREARNAAMSETKELDHERAIEIYRSRKARDPAGDHSVDERLRGHGALRDAPGDERD